MRRPLPRPARRRDDGAVYPMVGLLLVALLTMTAFTVDLGRLMYEQRDMQAVADVVSLDMARLADGRTLATINADPNTVNTLNLAAANNDVDPAQLRYTYLVCPDPSGRSCVPAGPSDQPNAVEVEATENVEFFFRVDDESGNAIRSAIAVQSEEAVMELGSRAVALSTNQAGLNNTLSSLLSPGMTAPPLNASLVGYSGLVDAEVSLLGLAAADATAGTPNDVLTSSYTVAQFGTLVANALDNQGKVAEANAFRYLSAQATGSTSVTLGSLFSLAGPGNGAVATAGLNAFSLFYAFAQAANSQALATGCATLPPLTLPASVVVTTTASCSRVISPPVIVSGPANHPATSPPAFSTAQVEHQIVYDGTFTPPVTGASSAAFSLPIAFRNAYAEGTLKDIVCDHVNPSLTETLTGVTNQALLGAMGHPTTPVGTFIVLGQTVEILINKVVPLSSAASADIPLLVDQTDTGPGSSPSVGLRLSKSDVTLRGPVLSDPAVAASVDSAKQAIADNVNFILDAVDTNGDNVLDAIGGEIANSDLTYHGPPLCDAVRLAA